MTWFLDSEWPAVIIVLVLMFVANAAFGTVYQCPDGTFTDKGCGETVGEYVTIGESSQGLSEIEWSGLSDKERELLKEQERRNRDFQRAQSEKFKQGELERRDREIACENAREAREANRRYRRRGYSGEARYHDGHQRDLQRNISENCR